MIGICPNCKIELKKPPVGNRITNEVMVVMNYRSKKDKKIEIKPIDELGYCEICNATIDDLKVQNIK